MQYGTAGKTPSSVSLIAFGWPGRLRISARPRMTPTWRDRIAVGTYLRLTCAHLLAEARQHLVRDRQRRFRRDVARRGSGASGRQHQMAAHAVDELDQRALDQRCSSGISRVSIRHGVVSAAPNQSVRPGMPLILVHAGRVRGR